MTSVDPADNTGTACVFCGKIAEGSVDVLGRGVVMFEPLGPVVPGHRLFVPLLHVADAAAEPWVTANVAEEAARYARMRNVDFNLITSAGSAATQTIRHLHIHYVPRREDDGLHLPWTGQQ